MGRKSLVSLEVERDISATSITSATCELNAYNSDGGFTAYTFGNYQYIGSLNSSGVLTDTAIRFRNDFGVDLYYNDSLRAATNQYGMKVSSNGGSAILEVETTGATNSTAQINLAGWSDLDSGHEFAKIIFENNTASKYNAAAIVVKDPAGDDAQGDGELVFQTSDNGVLGDVLTMGKAKDSIFENTVHLRHTTNADSVFSAFNSAGGTFFYTDSGGNGCISQAASGAFEEKWINCARNGAVSLYYNGVSKFSTTLNGAKIVYDGLNSAELQVYNDVLGGVELGTSSTISKSYLSAITNAGVFSSFMIGMDYDAEVSLYYNGTVKLETTSDGTKTSGTGATYHEIGTSGNNTASCKVYNSYGGTELRVNPDTGTGIIAQTSSAGVAQDIHAAMHRDGAIEFYHNNVKKFATADYGLHCRGEIKIIKTDASTAMFRAINSYGGVLWYNAAADGAAVIAQANTSGSYEEAWINCARNGAVKLHHNGVAKFETYSSGTKTSGTATTYHAIGSSGNNTTGVKCYNSVAGVNLYVDPTSGSAGIAHSNSSGGAVESYIYMNRNASVDLFYNGSKKVTTASYGFYCIGEIRATGDIIDNYSDDRLKTKTGNLTQALDKINTLTAFHYHANDVAEGLGYKKEKLEIGLSAQEVEEILPEAIAEAPINQEVEDGTEYKAIKYNRLIPLLVEGIKELSTKNDTLTTQNETLTGQVETLIDQIDALTDRVEELETP